MEICGGSRRTVGWRLSNGIKGGRLSCLIFIYHSGFWCGNLCLNRIKLGRCVYCADSYVICFNAGREVSVSDSDQYPRWIYERNWLLRDMRWIGGSGPTVLYVRSHGEFHFIDRNPLWALLLNQNWIVVGLNSSRIQYNEALLSCFNQ